MASGSSAGRPGSSGSKVFDFASDDILCSYEDFGNQESSNGSHSDPVIGTPVIGTNSSTKDFPKTRMTRSSVFPPSNAYAQPEDSSNQELILTVERTMKKYADNLMRFLEGISSRLSQLELYCYNLDKSIGEMRSELSRDHGEADAKLKAVDKHLQEVHRSVQILRDKQELADTQKELAKLQLAQKESSSGGSQLEDRTPKHSSDSKKQEDAPEMQNQQLALALPHQVAPPQPSHPTRTPEQQQSVLPPSQAPPQTIPSPQQPSYYMGPTQLPNPPTQPQPPQGPYLTADSQYRPPQGASIPQQSQVNQPAPVQQYPQYQQQWPQPVQASQPPAPAPPPQVQAQNPIRAPTPPSNVYPSYIPGQPTNAPPQESLSSSMPMQAPLSGIPQPGGISRSEPTPYGYGAGRPHNPHLPPHHMKGGDGYPAPGNHPAISSGGSYVIYDGEGPRQHHPPPPGHFSQGGAYPPPSNVSLHNPHLQPPPPSASSGMMIRGPSPPPQFVRNHPYNELIEKMVSMGYRADHVASVIQRLDENGQAVDFNSVLDRLNGQSSQRGW